MAKMIQIRNVPDDLHRSLKVRAAKAGVSLSDYLLGEVEEIAAKPTLAELLERLEEKPPLEVAEQPEAIIRRDREAG